MYKEISEAAYGALMIAGLVDVEDVTMSSDARCYRDMALSVLRQLPPIDYGAITNHTAAMPTIDARVQYAQSRVPMAFFVRRVRLCIRAVRLGYHDRCAASAATAC